MMAWLLVFHLLGLAFWIGALLLVSKLLGVHTQETSPDARQTLVRVERSLLNGWAFPGAAIMLVTGFWLLTLNPGYYLRAGWFHTKLLLVVVLVGFHVWTWWRARALAGGRTGLRRAEFGALHGLVALVFLGILILVFLKPF